MSASLHSKYVAPKVQKLAKVEIQTVVEDSIAGTKKPNKVPQKSAALTRNIKSFRQTISRVARVKRSKLVDCNQKQTPKKSVNISHCHKSAVCHCNVCHCNAIDDMSRFLLLIDCY